MAVSSAGRHSGFTRLGLGLIVAVAAGVAAGARAPQSAPAQGPTPQAGPRCRVEGRVTSGSDPLPGATVVVRVGSELRAATSTDLDGRYVILFAPGVTYHISADLTAFVGAERDLTLSEPPCDTTVDFKLTLRPRREALTPAPAPTQASAAPAPAPSNAEPTPAPAAAAPTQEQASAVPTPAGQPAAGRQAGAGRGGAGRGRGAGAQTGQAGQTGQAAQRFETLNVQADANGAAALDTAAPADPAEVTRLLPPGFSAETAQADAVAINGSGDATNLDRGALNDRFAAIGLGQFDPATGQFAGGGVGAGGQPIGGAAGPGRAGGPGGPGAGGRGGPGGRAGGPGPGGGGPGRGNFLGGRGARGQSAYQGTTTYTFGGSALNALPYQVRPDAPVGQPQYAQNNFGTTFGGPLRIPKVYEDTNRRTNFQINYTGNRSNNLFDQYATVPTEAMRNGDFSASPIQLVDPLNNNQPFAGNQIPAGRIDPTAAALLAYIPLPNLPGTAQNYHVSTTSHTASDNISLRVSQNLSPTVAPGGRGGPGGGRGGFGGFGGGRGGPGGRGGAGRGTNIMLNVQMQYRRNENEQLNVFPNLGGKTTNTTIAAPISLNVSRGRTVHNFSVSVTHSNAESTNSFSGVQNVAGQAGINYPSVASTDPLNWGVPNLSFSGYTGLRGASANTRTDNRITTGYVWSHPFGTHQVRMGGDYRFDSSVAESNSNPRGSFTFTGLYASGGSPVSGRTGADFADFLLGAPQQATLQVGDVTHLHGHSFDAYLEDNWQKSAKLTFNLGLRYELVKPYVELSGQMANLDAAPGFTSVAPVEPGAVGPYTGAFPAGLLNTDINNIGPRVGVAYRMAPGTILRGGYSITYNPGSYAAIARQLVAQPPFAETGTVAGTNTTPLSLQNALLAFSGTTNNYGVDRDYALGTIQTWNTTLNRNLNAVWSIVVGYTGTKGTNLDVLSAPNRGPGGTLLIPNVEPFTWESSTGHSIMNAGNFQLVRRLAHGVAGSASYTVAKAMDNSPSLGAGSTTVAQNNQDLASEWALSNFDRRQQFTGNLLVELPFGANRRWLDRPGLLPTIVGGWSLSLLYTAQTGTPLTARVVGAASDVSQGTNGSLRADYTGAPVSEGDPTLTQFFNTSAFAVPAAGLFGDSSRNMIIGPGGNQLNGSLIRDVPLGGNKGVTLQINATNLLNTVQWQAIDTNVNSPTFGQVLSARPMRALTLTTRFRF